MRDAPGNGDVDLDSIVREMAEIECKPPLNFQGSGMKALKGLRSRRT